MFSFVKEITVLMKLMSMCYFLIPAVIAMLIGLIFSKFKFWKRDVGVVLLSASGFMALVAVTFLALFISPSRKEFFPDLNIIFFSDYIKGFSFLALVALTGFLLIIKRKKPSERI